MVKFESIIEKHNLKVDDLPEKITRKIENFDELYYLYEEAEEDSKEESDLELKLNSLDDGICNDLESYVADMQKQEGGQASQTPSTPQQNTPPSNKEESSSNWMFWM